MTVPSFAPVQPRMPAPTPAPSPRGPLSAPAPGSVPYPGDTAGAKLLFTDVLNTLSQALPAIDQKPVAALVGANLLAAARNLGEGINLLATLPTAPRPEILEALSQSQGTILLATEMYLRGDSQELPKGYLVNEISQAARPVREALTDLSRVPSSGF